jgi:hypothetical protein
VSILHRGIGNQSILTFSLESGSVSSTVGWAGLDAGRADPRLSRLGSESLFSVTLEAAAAGRTASHLVRPPLISSSLSWCRGCCQAAGKCFGPSRRAAGLGGGFAATPTTVGSCCC